MTKISDYMTRIDDNVYQFDLPKDAINEQDLTEKKSIRRIQIQVPSEFQGNRNYCLTQKVGSWLWKNKDDLTLPKLREGIQIKIADEGIAGTWSVQVATNSWLWDTFKSYIPGFFQTYDSPEEVRLEVKPASGSVLSCLNPWGSKTISDENQIKTEILSTPIDKNLAAVEPYLDDFTRLATLGLQQQEKKWVFSPKSEGEYRIIIKGPDLVLDQIKPDQDKDENVKAVALFKKSIQNLYGDRTISHAKLVYGIDLDAMIKDGAPLYPDVVFKFNIASMHIEMRDSELLLGKLKAVQKMISGKNEQLEKLPLSDMLTTDFSIRESRGLIKAIQKFSGIKDVPNVLQVKQFLLSLLKNDPQNPTEMKSKDFNVLISMIQPTHEEFARACTGRKIIDRAIMGFHTEGDKNVEDKCRDLFELRHIFEKLRKTDDWKNWYAQLAYVAVKKSLYTEIPDPENSEKTIINVGLLIPGPKDSNGNDRWYRVESFINNEEGDVNYHLVPVTDDCVNKDGELCPFVKLYRSTASNTNTVGSDDSLAADLNPFDDAPNTGSPDVAYPYEKPYFDSLSIPAWVSFLEIAQKVKANYEHPTSILDEKQKNYLKTKYQKYYLRSLHYFVNSNKEHKDVERAQSLLVSLLKTPSDKLYIEADAFIYKTADEAKELREYKIERPVTYVGQSLGGGLSQHNTHRLMFEKGRLMLGGGMCVSFCGPGIGEEKNAKFYEAGREYRAIFKHLLKKPIVIDHNFEAHDFVPTVGKDKIGTRHFQIKDKVWLNWSGGIYTPLPTATSKEITTAPTHGRTFWYDSVEGKDYAKTNLTPFNVDDSIAKTLTLLKWPTLTETVRKTAGWALYPYFKWHEWYYSSELPNDGKKDEDETGVLFVKYQPIKV